MQENNLSEHFKKSLITLTDLAKVAILDDYKSSTSARGYYNFGSLGK